MGQKRILTPFLCTVKSSACFDPQLGFQIAHLTVGQDFAKGDIDDIAFRLDLDLSNLALKCVVTGSGM